MKNLIYDYIKTSISPIKLLEISKELEIDFKSVKECVTQLENESLIFKHSNRGYLSTPERVKEVKQAKVSSNKAIAPKKPRKPSKSQQIKDLKEKIKAEKKNKPKEPKIRKQRQKMDAETWRKHKREYDASRRVKRKLLHGECEATRIKQLPYKAIEFYDEVISDNHMIYLRPKDAIYLDKGAYSFFSIEMIKSIYESFSKLSGEIKKAPAGKRRFNLLGENSENRIPKLPRMNIGFDGDLMASDDNIYFKSDKNIIVRDGAVTCMKIADLERLLTIVKELQSEN